MNVCKECGAVPEQISICNQCQMGRFRTQHAGHAWLSVTVFDECICRVSAIGDSGKVDVKAAIR